MSSMRLFSIFVIAVALALFGSIAAAANREAADAAANAHAVGLARAQERVSAQVEASENARVEDKDQDESQAEPEDASKPAGGPKDQTAGARPGWGCGDQNHVHTGPPGDGATSPCAKAPGEGTASASAAGTAGHSSGHSQGAEHRANPNPVDVRATATTRVATTPANERSKGKLPTTR